MRDKANVSTNFTSHEFERGGVEITKHGRHILLISKIGGTFLTFKLQSLPGLRTNFFFISEFPFFSHQLLVDFDHEACRICVQRLYEKYVLYG